MNTIFLRSLRGACVTLMAALATMSAGAAWAGALDALTNKDTSGGLRAA